MRYTVRAAISAIENRGLEVWFAGAHLHVRVRDTGTKTPDKGILF